MSNQQQQGNQKRPDPNARIQFEKRKINTTGIIISVVAMVVIAALDFLGGLAFMSWVLSASPFATEWKVFVHVAAGFIFLGSALFAVHCAKQNQ